MAKKLLCMVALLLAVVFLLASCDNSDNAPSTPENPTHTHAYGEWEIVKAATCTTDGSKERYCSCGEKQTKAVEATGHSFGEWIVDKAATSTAKGIEKRRCECGASESRDIDMLPAVTTVTASEWRNAFDFSKYGSITVVGSEIGSEDGIDFDFDVTIKYYAGTISVSTNGADYYENDAIVFYEAATLTNFYDFYTLGFNELQRLMRDFEELSDFGYSRASYSATNKSYQAVNQYGDIYTFWFENGVLVKYSYDDNGQAEYLRATYEFKNMNSTASFSIPTTQIKTEYLQIVNSISSSTSVYYYDSNYERVYCNTADIKEILRSMKIDIVIEYEKGTLNGQINNYTIKTNTMSSLDKTLYLEISDGKLRKMIIGDVYYYVA